MGRKNKKSKKKVSTAAAPSGGLGGLGDLLAQAGLQSSPERSAEAATPAAAADPGLQVPNRVVLQHSRKGRGGRTVTLVRGLPPQDLDRWAKAVRKALGCGASIEDDAIVLQGDLRDRAATWFTEQGVGKVSR